MNALGCKQSISYNTAIVLGVRLGEVTSTQFRNHLQLVPKCVGACQMAYQRWSSFLFIEIFVILYNTAIVPGGPLGAKLTWHTLGFNAAHNPLHSYFNECQKNEIFS